MLDRLQMKGWKGKSHVKQKDQNLENGTLDYVLD
jgi:hypothetical protein